MRYIFIGHGSRSERWNKEFLGAIDDIKKRNTDKDIVPYLLHNHQESLINDIGEWYKSGEESYALIPCFLFPGKHASADINDISRMLRKKNPAINLETFQPLGKTDGITGLLVKRLSESKPVIEKSTAILLVTLGGDKEKNLDFIDHYRLVIKKAGFSQQFYYSFIDLECRDITDQLKKIKSDGHIDIYLFPFLLFEGFLLNFLREKIDDIKKILPGMNIYTGSHLGRDEHLLGELESRLL